MIVVYLHTHTHTNNKDVSKNSKLLGVQIDNELTFKQHIVNICKNVNKKLFPENSKTSFLRGFLVAKTRSLLEISRSLRVF